MEKFLVIRTVNLSTMQMRLQPYKGCMKTLSISVSLYKMAGVETCKAMIENYLTRADRNFTAQDILNLTAWSLAGDQLGNTKHKVTTYEVNSNEYQEMLKNKLYLIV
jgi:hypothetical protein